MDRSKQAYADDAGVLGRLVPEEPSNLACSARRPPHERCTAVRVEDNEEGVRRTFRIPFSIGGRSAER